MKVRQILDMQGFVSAPDAVTCRLTLLSPAVASGYGSPSSHDGELGAMRLPNGSSDSDVFLSLRKVDGLPIAHDDHWPCCYSRKMQFQSLLMIIVKLSITLRLLL